MIKLAAVALVSSLSFAACAIDDGGGEFGDTQRMCTTDVDITGRVTGRPSVFEDFCQAVGTWTFTPTARASANACSGVALDPIVVEVSYECPAGRDCSATAADPADKQYVIAYQSGPSVASRQRIKLTNGGSGICEGIVELFSQDGKSVYNLHPNLHEDGTLDGQGDFSRFPTDQWYEE